MAGRAQVAPKLLATINTYLKEHGLLVSQGTLVDATLIHAPSSTKNKDKARAPDMHQTKEGLQWYVGMKIHIGANVNSGAVHTVTTTTANVVDITELPKLLREDDRIILADADYTRDEYRRGAWHLGLRWCVNDKRKLGKNLSSSQKKRNRKQSSVRARVEHVFRVIKQQFGFQKTRYRDLEKNASQVIYWWG